MKITIPANSAKNGGNLYTLIDDLTNLNSEVSRIRSGDNLIIDDGGASVKIELDETIILSILAEGGEIENQQFAVKAPISLASQTVPAGVPIRTNALGTVKTFVDWFLPGSELWRNTPDSLIVFYTNPLGGQASVSQYLKGSEIKLIKDIDAVNITILNLTEAQAEVANPNYVKIVW